MTSGGEKSMGILLLFCPCRRFEMVHRYQGGGECRRGKKDKTVRHLELRMVDLVVVLD